jgi:hypothetical protein
MPGRAAVWASTVTDLGGSLAFGKKFLIMSSDSYNGEEQYVYLVPF